MDYLLSFNFPVSWIFPINYLFQLIHRCNRSIFAMSINNWNKIIKQQIKIVTLFGYSMVIKKQKTSGKRQAGGRGGVSSHPFAFHFPFYLLVVIPCNYF